MPNNNKVGTGIQRAWWRIRDLYHELKPCRFSLIVALIAVLVFLCVAQGTEILRTSSDEMLDFLQAGTNDFVQNALSDASRDVNSIRTKIGVIDKSYWSQTSLVERNLADHGKPIRYVISILNNKATFLLTRGTIEPLDQCILTRHPGAAPR